MSRSARYLGWALACASGMGWAAGTTAVEQPLGLGQPVTPQRITAWDIDVGPDGAGLPRGQGTASEGEPIFLAKCAACHGEFGEGAGRFPALVSDSTELTAERPRKTVGNCWPYATTLWDYINRGMPFGNAQSLSADEVYSMVAYILSMNEIIDDEQVMNAHTLPRVQMPNRNGFITATGTDIKVKACMHDCVDKVVVSSRASDHAAATEGE